MDAWSCHEPKCGLLLRTEAGRHGQDKNAGTRGHNRPPGPSDYDWEEERPRRGWRLFTGLVILAVITALVAMMMSPLLWPQTPSLHVSPTQLLFVDDAGSGVMPQAIVLRNQGRVTLEWEVRSDASWLNVEPTSGTLEADLQVLTVRVDTTGLPEGTHHTGLTVAAERAHNSPQIIQVQVHRTTSAEIINVKNLIGPNVDVYQDVQPPYMATPLGVPIELVNNDEAVDVTWNELMDFLVADPTDESPYIPGLHMCGAFAQQLHNNAESAGIRSAWVSIDLRGKEIGHALNAFETLDRGLVFVDCTGADATVISPAADFSGCDHDKIAYVRTGREYGLISLDRAESPKYTFYEQYSRSWDKYLADLEEFNLQAQEYNEFVSSRSLVAGSEDARHAQWLYNELEAARVTLEMQRELLGPCRWNTLGIVESVRIYW